MTASPSPFSRARWIQRLLCLQESLPEDPVWPRDQELIVRAVLANGSDQALAWVLSQDLIKSIQPALNDNVFELPRFLHALWMHTLNPRSHDDGKELATWLQAPAPAIDGGRPVLTYLKASVFSYAYDQHPFGPLPKPVPSPEATAFSDKVIAADPDYSARAPALVDLILRTAHEDLDDEYLDSIPYGPASQTFPAIGAPPRMAPAPRTTPMSTVQWLPRILIGQALDTDPQIWPRDAATILPEVLANGSDQAFRWALINGLDEQVGQWLAQHGTELPYHLWFIWKAVAGEGEPEEPNFLKEARASVLAPCPPDYDPSGRIMLTHHHAAELYRKVNLSPPDPIKKRQGFATTSLRGLPTADRIRSQNAAALRNPSAFLDMMAHQNPPPEPRPEHKEPPLAELWHHYNDTDRDDMLDVMAFARPTHFYAHPVDLWSYFPATRNRRHQIPADWV